ncbi:MAG TPA: hypothetical protein VJX30_20555 [Terriglobales bacterium]|nr:hypothetical protein [Terriglobales bacterium]
MRLDHQQGGSLFNGHDIEKILSHAMSRLDKVGEWLVQIRYHASDAQVRTIFAKFRLPRSERLAAISLGVSAERKYSSLAAWGDLETVS